MSLLRRLGDSLSPSSPSDTYLRYHDIVLTVEDVKALRGDWLTDTIISFWEEWLEHEILPHYPRAKIKLLRPSMAFILLREQNIDAIRNALGDFNRITHIFIPINDNRNVDRPEGGSHWSLLLVSVIDGVAFHYDSLRGSNFQEAWQCTNKLSHVLKRPLRFQQLDETPQQENGIDCGIFVCILMRHLLVKRLLNASASEKVSMSMGGKMIDAHGGRKEILKIIEDARRSSRNRSPSPMTSSGSK